MPVSLEPKLLLAYFVISIIIGFGWHVGSWLAGKILSIFDRPVR